MKFTQKHKSLNLRTINIKMSLNLQAKTSVNLHKKRRKFYEKKANFA